MLFQIIAFSFDFFWFPFLLGIFILGAFLCYMGFLSFFRKYNDVYFIMDSNNLIVIKKELCRKKTHIYNPGELIRIDFNHNENNYSLVIVVKNGNNDNIFNIKAFVPIFTNEEIDYFLYYINTHIQTKMRV